MAKTKALPASLRLPMKVDGRFTQIRPGDILVDGRGHEVAKVKKITEATVEEGGKARRFRFTIEAEEV
jgi:hypothetical protein